MVLVSFSYGSFEKSKVGSEQVHDNPRKIVLLLR